MPVLIIVAILLIVGFLAVVYVLFFNDSRKDGAFAKNQMQAIVSAQRFEGSGKPKEAQRSSMFKVEPKKIQRNKSSNLTLAKKFKYAQWKRMSMPVYRAIQIVVSVFFYILICYVVEKGTGNKLSLVFQALILLTSGPLLVGSILERAVNKRFKAFDKDYPAFLLSLIGLIKTGMTTMAAIEAAAKGLDETSLMKQECDLMIERLRVGVPEEASIGAFAEDIYHPEVELFVQALLLSRRVGGTLSDTLDRLARQIRKRQYFRSQAHAAVGLQRGSVLFIVGIMVLLEAYLASVYPQAVFGAMKDPIGWSAWQAGIGVILTGMYWVRQVSKIKV